MLTIKYPILYELVSGILANHLHAQKPLKHITGKGKPQKAE